MTSSPAHTRSGDATVHPLPKSTNPARPAEPHSHPPAALPTALCVPAALTPGAQRPSPPPTTRLNSHRSRSRLRLCRSFPQGLTARGGHRNSIDKLIWQPRFYAEYDFEVYLDRDFARTMIQAKIAPERQKITNELANEELKKLGIHWSNPYDFYEDTGFIRQFYIGQNGVWLSTNHRNIDELLEGAESHELIKYDSHNVDTSRQAYVLMRIFDKWVAYADAMRG